jgi:hypothetical protein
MIKIPKEECEKIGGRVDVKSRLGCILDEIYYGEPTYLYGETKPKPQWLPLEVQKKFWQANFMPEWITRQLAETQLNSMGVTPVKGSIYIPSEKCRYSQIYSYKNILFVPKTCEVDSDRYMKFQAIGVKTLIPLDANLKVESEVVV